MLLGVSERMVRNYVKDKALPCKEDGRGRRFCWPDVLEWYVAYRAEMTGSDGSQEAESGEPEDETLDQATCRKTIAEADLKELELAKQRGLVVAISDVQQSIADIAKSIQTKILGLPSKLLGRIFGMKDRNALKQILDSECRQLCHELLQVGQGFDASPSADGDDPARDEE